jgi:hypothetical protein
MSAGLIKFNPDWLSGNAMLAPPVLRGKLLEWACAYAIVLELVWAPLLLVLRGPWFWGALAQFIFFHLFSWHIVGYFYPCIMLGLLSLFVLSPRGLSLGELRFPRASLAAVMILLFVAAQLYPFFTEKNAALNGRGRLLSLNMLDAKATCENQLILRYQDRTVEQNVDHSMYAVRIHCDPLVYLHEMKGLCEDQALQEGFVDADFSLQTRRVSDPHQTETLALKNICSQPPRIGFLGEVYQ